MAYERSFHPGGVARQMAAVAASDNRRPSLERVDLPALVIHGKVDPLVPEEAASTRTKRSRVRRYG